MKYLTLTLLSALFLGSAFDLTAGGQYTTEVLIEETRMSVEDLRHELKSLQVDLNLVNERINKQELAAKATNTQKPSAESSQTQVKLSALEKKLSQVETLLDKATADLRTLNTHVTQSLSKIDSLEHQLTSHDQRLDEVSKLKGTLTSISKAIGQTNAAPTPNGKTYRVKAGDSLEKIARTQHINVEALKKLNQLTSDKIIVGQELKLADESQ